MARPEQVLLLEPQHELKFRGKRGGPGFDVRGGRALAANRVGGTGKCYGNQVGEKLQYVSQKQNLPLKRISSILKDNRSAASLAAR